MLHIKKMNDKKLMATYIVFLRGINVSGQKKIKMIDLKAHLQELNFRNIQTYVQSGNVIFQHGVRTPKQLENEIEKKILEKYGFHVPTLVILSSELESVLNNNPFLNEPDKDPSRMYVTFLFEIPKSQLVGKIEYERYSPEQCVLAGKIIYLFSPGGYGRAKMNNNFFENKLKVSATTRNWKTINNLVKIVHEIN